MSYEDRISIPTPEGVTLEVVLAGVGSRFSAAIIDLLIQGAAMVGLGLVAAALGAVGGAVLAIGGFVVLVGYDVAFETWNSGRTPGKAVAGLRVVRAGGAPVGFLTSAIRNLLRLIDLLPTAYLIGIISILSTRHNQRIGDLAAGTVVVRERGGATPERALLERQPITVPDATDHWDVSAVTQDEVSTVQRFLERRASLSAEARWKLAWDLAARLRPKVAGADDDSHPEEFLSQLVAVKRTRRL